jgi:DNA-binding transcriptional MerR regulator
MAWTKGEKMGRKRYTAEQIIGMLREAEVLQSQGMTIGEISRKLAITEQTDLPPVIVPPLELES